MILREALNKSELSYSISTHGAVEFLEETTEAQFEKLNENLMEAGLELLDKNDSMLIDRIIQTVIDVIHDTDELPQLSFDDIIDNGLGTGNDSILKIFSDVKGMSIMQFIVLEKIERVKEFLLYDDLSITEIAERLRYKNSRYLTAQFKKYTGLTPSYFKNIKKERKRILETA